MCANYNPARNDQLRHHFHVAPPRQSFSPEAYPGYLAPMIRLALEDEEDSELACVLGSFGLVPHWADTKLAKSTYNARTETVGSKPSFRHAYRRRQFCVVPVDSFYEPNYETGRAVRWKISHAEGVPLGIAGIWEYKKDGPDGVPLFSFSMLTINADDHPILSRFHKPGDEKRMLVILQQNDYASWLHAPLEQVPSFFTPFPADALVAEPAPRPAAARSAIAKPEPGSLF